MKKCKRIMALITSLALIATMGVFSVSAATPVVNYEFEQDTTGWSAWNGAISHNVTNTYNGSAGSLELGAKAQAVSAVTLEAGETYLVTGYAYIPSTSSFVTGARFGIRNYLSSSDAPVSGTNILKQTAAILTTSGGWKCFSVKLTVGTDTSWYLFTTLNDAANASYTNLMYIDNVKVEKPDSLISNGGFETFDVTSTGTKMASLWAHGSAATYSYVTDAHSGSYALKLTSSTNTETYRISNTVEALTAGKWYEVSVWAKKVGEGDGYANLYVFPLSGSASLANKLTNTVALSSTDWTKYSCKFKLATGQTSVRVQLLSLRFSDDQYVLMDDVSFVEMKSGIEVTDNSGQAISTINTAGTYKAKFNLVNTDTVNPSSKVGIIARYKVNGTQKRLDGVETIAIDASADTAVTQVLSLEVPDFSDGTVYEIKAFMWNSISDLVSFCEAKSITSN